MPRYDWNCWKWLEWLEMAASGWKWQDMPGMALHDWKGVEWLEMACYCWKWLEIAGTFFKWCFQKAGLDGIGWPDLINFIELICSRD